jgi:signal transduction histidine kinase
MVTVRTSLVENEDLIEGIIFSLALVFLLMITALLIANYFSTQKLWNPFKTILERIRQFDFRSGHHYEPVKTSISEFKELNSELTRMTTKLTKDYLSLKEFSENASHEMQTPLAIIQSKLELLFQQRGFDEESLNALKSAYEAANRLSRLHNELNLLTRIENKEFKEHEKLSFRELLDLQIENFSDLVEMKGLVLTKEIQANPVVDGNKYLVEILLSNLFSNAIKHNISEGTIALSLTDKSFTISNTGEVPAESTDMYFERFRKRKAASNSTGLGLALVKQICILHDFKIEYIYENNLHKIQVTFL